MRNSASASSRFTLAVGGCGIVIATLIPLAARAVFMFPVPNDFSWLNYSWQPLPAQLSAGVLVVAFSVLAIGIRQESGIAGTSIVGKLALILFALATLALTIIGSGPLPPLGTSPNAVALLAVGSWTCILLELAALIVASIVVFRAGVIRGVARWGLLVLAITLAVTLALSYIHIRAVGEVVVWGYPVALVIQLLTGVLYLLHGQRPALRSRLQVGAAAD